MHVFVAGATGAIGRPLIAQLVAAGHEVTATTRSAARVEQLEALGARPVVADGLDSAAMTRAVLDARPDAIVHQMTALAGKPDLRRFDRWFATTNALRTEGTDILLAAAGEAGVRRFVAQSYTGWTNPRSGGPVKTERDPLDPAPAAMQRQSLAAIRHVEETVPAARLDGIVLRYGNFYGPGASDALVELVRKRRSRSSATARGCGRGSISTTRRRRPSRRSSAATPASTTSRTTSRLRPPSGCRISRRRWQPAWRSWRDGFREALGETARSVPDRPATVAQRQPKNTAAVS